MSLLFRAMYRDCSDHLIRVGFRIQICESLHCQASLSNILNLQFIPSSPAMHGYHERVSGHHRKMENGKRFSFSAAWWDVIMGWSWHATPRLYTLSYKIWNKENSAQQIFKQLALAPRTKILNPVCFLCCLISMLAAMQVFKAMVPASDGMQWTHWSTMQSLCLLSIVTHFYLK